MRAQAPGSKTGTMQCTQMTGEIHAGPPALLITRTKQACIPYLVLGTPIDLFRCSCGALVLPSHPVSAQQHGR